jgi:hypothetical protein
MSFPPPPLPVLAVVTVTLPPLQLGLGAVTVAGSWGLSPSSSVLRGSNWRAAKLPATTWREINLKTRAGPPWRGN